MDLQKVDCMVQTFPLAKANEAFSKLVSSLWVGSGANDNALLPDAMMDGSVRFRAVIVME